MECLPDKLPPQIEIDLSPLTDAEDAIHVRDIVLDVDIHVANDPDQMVVKVAEARVEIEAEVVEEEEAAVAEEAEAVEAAESSEEAPEE